MRGVRALLRWAKFSFAHQKRTRNGSRAGGAGLVFSFGQAACAPRGPERFFIKADCSLLMSKEKQKTTSDFDALDPRERGCSPLSDPEGVVEAQKC